MTCSGVFCCSIFAFSWTIDQWVDRLGPQGIFTYHIYDVWPLGNAKVFPELIDIVRFIGSAIGYIFAIDAANIGIRIKFNNEILISWGENQIQAYANTVGLWLIAQKLSIFKKIDEFFQPVRIRDGNQAVTRKFQNCIVGLVRKIGMFWAIGKFCVNRPVFLRIYAVIQNILPCDRIVIGENIILIRIVGRIGTILFPCEMI